MIEEGKYLTVRMHCYHIWYIAVYEKHTHCIHEYTLVQGGHPSDPSDLDWSNHVNTEWSEPEGADTFIYKQPFGQQFPVVYKFYRARTLWNLWSS